MIEVFGDLWTYTPLKDGAAQPIIRCITTNGMVKRDGTCVMGRGCAREAAKKWPLLPHMIGSHIRESGNVVGSFIPRGGPFLLSFPVKHKWMEPADPDLISKSAQDLEYLARQDPGIIYLLPRPGCGNGQLAWKDVRPLLEFLPDNVLVITNEDGPSR